MKAKKIKSKARRSTRKKINIAAEPVVAPPAPRPQAEKHDWLPFFLLSLYAACYVFSLILLVPIPVGPKLIETRIFITSWIVVPAFSLGAAWGLRHLKRGAFLGNEVLLPALLSVNTAAWSWFWYRIPADVNQAYLRDIAFWIPAFNFGALCLAYSPSLARWRFWQALGSWSAILTPVSLAIALRQFSQGEMPVGSRWVMVALGAGAATLLSFSRHPSSEGFIGRWLARIFYVTVALLLFALVLDESTFHQNMYLHSVHDVIHGKSMLVDANCQYGVGAVYFVAALFKLSSITLYYKQFCFVVMMLYIAQYAGLFWILRRIFKSQWIAMLCVAFGVAVERFGFYTYGNISFPAVGPLRFGIPLLLFSLVYLRREGKGLLSLGRLPELVLMGIAAPWSFETFVYAAAGYAAVIVFESWAESSSPAQAAATALKKSLQLLMVLCLSHLLFALFTRARSGSWPHWGMYLEYIGLYTSYYFSVFKFEALGPWIYVAGLSLISVMACLFGLVTGRDTSAGNLAIFALSVSGLAEYSYFMGRPHPDNLSHVCLSSVVPAFYWLDRLVSSPSVTKPFKLATVFSAFLLGAAHVNACWPNIYRELTVSMLYCSPETYRQYRSGQPLTISSYFHKLWVFEELEPEILPKVELINKYAPEGSRVAVFVDPRIFSKLLFRINKTHVFPMATPSPPTNMIPSSLKMALGMQHALKAGDLVFAARDEKGSWLWPDGANNGDASIEIALFEKIKSQFDFELLESAAGLQVLRLKDKAPEAKPLI